MHSLFRSRTRAHTAILARSCNCIVKVLQSDSRRLCQWKRIGIASRRVDWHRRSIERGSLDAVKVVQPPLRGSSFENPRHVRGIPDTYAARSNLAELDASWSVQLLDCREGKESCISREKGKTLRDEASSLVIPRCRYSILCRAETYLPYDALPFTSRIRLRRSSLQLLVVMHLSLRVHHHFLHLSFPFTFPLPLLRVLNARRGAGGVDARSLRD
jgi:hypothetical protein